MYDHLWELSLNRKPLTLSIRFLIQGHKTNTLCFVSLICPCISLWRHDCVHHPCDYYVIMFTHSILALSHCVIMLIHLACSLCATNHILSRMHTHAMSSLMHCICFCHLCHGKPESLHCLLNCMHWVPWRAVRVILSFFLTPGSPKLASGSPGPPNSLGVK